MGTQIQDNPHKPTANPLTRLGLLHARTRVPIFVGAMIIAILQLQRLAVWLGHHDRFDEVSAGQIAQAFWVGLRFDLVIAGMLVVPLLLPMFGAQPGLLARRWFKRTIAAFSGAVVALVVLMAVADALFFAEFGLRLNHQVFNYLPSAGNAYIYQTIADRYPLWPMLIGLVAVGLLVAAAVVRWGFDDRYNVGRLWHGVVWPTLFTALLVLAIRGTVSSHAINTGPAYFSPSMPLSQLALNGPFTLRQAIAARLSDNASIDGLFDLPPTAEIERIARDRVFAPGDRPVANPANPLHRITPGRRPQRDLNVVMIVLESMHWAYVGHLGGEGDLTPHIDELAQAGVHAPHAYAVGGRTQRAFAALLSSFPDLPARSVTTRGESTGRFLTLAQLLKQRGYRTMFIYGGPGHRDHRQTFLGSNGVDQFIVEDDLPVRTYRTALGYNDRDLFQSAIEVLNRQPDDRPFFALMLTLTFHPSYQFPGSDQMGLDTEDQRQLPAVKFTDAALGLFFEQARAQPWFDDTLFVVVADHSGGVRMHPRGPAMYRVPVVFYGPGIDGLAPRAIDGVRSQMDVPPTVMGLLGGDYEHCFFGRDMLADPATSGYGLALTGNDEILYFTHPDRVVVVRPGGGGQTLRFDPQSPTAQRRATHAQGERRTALSLMGLAERLFLTGRYHGQPPRPTGDADRPFGQAPRASAHPTEVLH